ncbi:MAG: GLUG motif-containing protein, partial [Sedimentisphaerales bacterium]
LVGKNSWYDPVWISYSGTISNCYSTGSVIGTTAVGGLVGCNEYGEVMDSFWDTETSGEPNMCGNPEDPNCDNSYGLPTSQLYQQSTFTDWDFINVWAIGENQTYPYLRVYLAGDINKDGIVNFLDIAITANQWMGE